MKEAAAPRYRIVGTLTLVLALVFWGGAAGAQSPPDSLVYAVSTLAPPDVTVPPILLEDARLHALLVELTSGRSLEEAGERLDLAPQERGRLLGLIEMEGLGRLGPEGWQPRVLALDREGAATLRQHAALLASVISDSLDARWDEVDSLAASFPVAGRLPRGQTGFVLLGDYLLGRMQAGLFWLAGLAPRDRAFAFRVYRLPPGEAPSGHSAALGGEGGFRIARYAPTTAPYGLALLQVPDAPITRALADDAAERERLRADVLEAYRTWYLLGTPPGASARRLLVRMEAVDEEGRLRVPLIASGDLEAMERAAGRLADLLWPAFQDRLGATAELADQLGYGEPGLLGEVALWTWEMAANLAVRDLVERGRILPPPSGRGQAILVPRTTPEPR